MKDETREPRPINLMRVRRFIYFHAISGDQSFASQALTLLCALIEAREPLDEDDLMVLSVFLLRILESSQGINIICGAQHRRGADKRGKKGVLVVLDVLRNLETPGTTVEAAWAEVAVKHSLSESMVKRYWSQWRKPVEDSFLDPRKRGDMEIGI